MENQITAENAPLWSAGNLFKKLLGSFQKRPSVFKSKSRAEVIGKVIEDLTFEITGRDFTNREVAFIINGIAKRGKAVLISRDDHLRRELHNTEKAINEIVK